MSATWAAVLALSLTSLLTTWIGVALAVRLGERAWAISGGIGFSVGIMLLVSVFELMPQALRALTPGPALGSFLLGVGLLWIANLIVPHTHLVREHGLADPALIKSTYLVLFGLILHDLPEGFAMAHAYIASPSLGILVATAIALHKAPEEFAMAVPVVVLRGKRLLYRAAVLSALAEPVGALIGLTAGAAAPWLNAHFMALAAGAMVFVSIHELVPMARRYRQPAQLLAGMAASMLAYAVLAAVAG